MKYILLIMLLIAINSSNIVVAQNITYSEIERNDNRNLNFEILGKFGDNFLIYKNIYKKQFITIYNNNMTIKEIVNIDFVSDRVSNIDFITYPNYFIMVWQYQKGNTMYCKAAKMSANGALQGEVLQLDENRESYFSNNTSYNITWSENKKMILLYKIQAKNDVFNLTTKVYDENLLKLDSTKKIISYNDRREVFGDLQIDDEGTYVFSKVIQNARPEFVNTVEINAKKLFSDTIHIVTVPLNNVLVQEPVIKIDNLNGRFLVNTFAYKKNVGNVDGILTAIMSRYPYTIQNTAVNVFNDSIKSKLSGKPDWRTAYDNFNLRNVILKKDGGFIITTEEYYKQRRYGGAYDDRFNSGGFYNNRYYGYTSDYYLYNRGYYGYYRPFGDQNNTRDIVYNYNDIVSISFNSNLQPQWSSVINKTTSDVETDNFLSFANMNAGAEVHFLFLQKDNNRQILSDFALQPNGSVIRYATLKSREAGFSFMPKLARQTGARQVLMPCVVRNNIAFAKIDF